MYFYFYSLVPISVLLLRGRFCLVQSPLALTTFEVPAGQPFPSAILATQFFEGESDGHLFRWNTCRCGPLMRVGRPLLTA